MKNSANKNLFYRISAILFAVFVTGSLAIAQPKPDDKKNAELISAYDRLEELMASIEESLKYVTPSDSYDDTRSARERLDLLASQTEEELQYIVPEETEVNQYLYVIDENLAIIPVTFIPGVFPYNFLQILY